TDNNGCTTASSVTITEPTVLTVTPGVATMINCFGANNGSFDVTAAGGTIPYSYNWSPAPGAGQGTASVTGLSAGAYTVTVTDNNGCTQTAGTTITEPTLLTAVMGVPVNVSCNGANDGSLTVTAGGGTINYTYSWSPSGGTGATASGLAAGTYTVTVTDNNGCTATASETVTQPTPLTSVMGTPTMVNCNGANNGSVSVTANGGTPLYTYVWSPAPGAGQGTASASNMAAGNYTVTITDNNGCTTASSVTITEPTALTAAISASTMVACNGANTGAATVTPGGGTAPYNYNWSPAPGSGQGTPSVSNLTANNYTVTVTDGNGCIATDNIAITEPTALALGSSVVNATCGGSNGTATVSIAGGVPNYSVEWNTTPVQTTLTATGIPAGVYTATVTDNNGCTATVSANVLNEASPTIAEVAGAHIDVSCFGGNDGSAQVLAGGGTGALVIAWSPSGGSASTASGLIAGTYTVTVTDANLCTATTSITVAEPTLLVSVPGVPTMVSCNNGSNGSASVAVNGGVLPYSYMWTPAPGAGQGTGSVSGLTAGTYDVVVTDGNGCSVSETFVITQPTALTGAMATVNVSCFAGNNGSATITMGGGVAPYTAVWSPVPGGGQGTTSATGLSAGLYTATVTDNNGCTFTVFPNITEPPVLGVTIAENDAHCGLADGGAVASSFGGTGLVNFVWNATPPQPGATLTGVIAGVYSVTATDANGCTTLASVTISDIPGPNISAAVNSNATGFSLCNGSGTATVSGLTPPLTIQWSNGNTNATANDLCAGTNCATVTDAAGCTATDCITITEPAALIVNLNPLDLNCFNICIGQVASLVSGGVAPYTYSWSNGSTTANLTNICAGNYTLTVTDANGNTASASTTVNQPTDIVLNVINSTNVLCNGACDGTVSANATGGTGALTYTWTGGLVGANQTGLCNGNYILVINDANGCVETGNIAITQPPVLTSSTTVVNANCGNPDGSATVTGNGGTAPYTFSWTAGSTSATQNGVVTGTYTATVTDANGCTSSSDAFVGDDPAGTLAINLVTPVLCYNGNNGSATGVVTGGAAPFSYNWDSNPVQTNQTATGLYAGTYVLTVTDNNNCIITETITLTQPTALNAVVSNTSVICYGGNTGTASAVPSGGNGPYTFNWVNSGGVTVGTTSTITGLIAGTYTVTITDANACTFTAITNVIEPPLYQVVINPEDAKCYNSCDGSAAAIVSGGTPPYTYQWNDPLAQTTIPAAFLCAGTYGLVVTDANGCLLNGSTTINQPTEL
ncbi:MAG TPA: hypothetical protein PK798_03040, partial [Flavobacteriales bacterium]|nr:hypothetical protein [Flavobacteriales bacterium]